MFFSDRRFRRNRERKNFVLRFRNGGNDSIMLSQGKNAGMERRLSIGDAKCRYGTSGRSSSVPSMVPTISFAIVHVFVHFELHAHSLNSDDMTAICRKRVGREGKWCAEKTEEGDNRKEVSRKNPISLAHGKSLRRSFRACPQIVKSKAKSRRAEPSRVENCEFPASAKSKSKSESWIIVAWFAGHATNISYCKRQPRFWDSRTETK